MSDWLGTGARSARDVAEKIIAETIRRVKLAAKNDSNFVPPVDAVTTVLANRIFTHTPSLSLGSTASGGDTQALLAARIFGGRFDPRITAPFLGSPVIYGGAKMNGQLLVVSDATGRITIDTSSLAAGTYILDVTAATGADRSVAKLMTGASGMTAIYRTATTNTEWNFANTKSFTIDSGLTITGNSVFTGTLNVTGDVTAPTFIGALTGNADTATALSHANQVVAGLGSSPALHNLITALIAAGIDLTDTTTP